VRYALCFARQEFFVKIHYWIATFAYCGFLYWLSSMSNPVGADIDIPGLDKTAHVVLYGGLAAIVSVGIHRNGRATPLWAQFLGPVAVVLAYGMADEFHQLFVPKRSFDPYDLLADVTGALLVQAILCGVLWRRRAVAVPPRE
jgi:VanZ family protein